VGDLELGRDWVRGVEAKLSFFFRLDSPHSCLVFDYPAPPLYPLSISSNRDRDRDGIEYNYVSWVYQLSVDVDLEALLSASSQHQHSSWPSKRKRQDRGRCAAKLRLTSVAAR
jgi:hypothetical protein